MRALILCFLFACSSGHKTTQEPLVISSVCTLTPANHILDETGADVGYFDPKTREVSIGSIQLPVRFTKQPDGIVVDIQHLAPFNVHVKGDDITVENKNVTQPLVARLSGFHGNRWLELAALITAIPAFPRHEPIDAGVDSAAAGDDVPPPAPPPNPHW